MRNLKKGLARALAACTAAALMPTAFGGSDCCVPNGTPGCDDPICQALICAQDAFCCNNSWDQICADAAVAQCPVCAGGGGDSDCCEANGTPGCDDPVCQALICAQDSFCCNNSWDQICADAAIAQCAVCAGGGGCAPACGTAKINVACLGGAQADNAAIVGQLRSSPNGAGFCTAWIIAAPDIMFTNNHCSPQSGDFVAFNFECDACNGGSEQAVTTFQVTSVLACNAAQDWCLFRVNGNVASQFGQATIDPSLTPVGTPIYEIHHAEGEVKGFDDGQVTGVNIGVNCPGSIPEHSVSVIASQGASGSPVFRVDNDCVTAACNCGPPCSPGFVLPMSTLFPNLQAAVQNAGSTILLCGQSAGCPGEGSCFEANGTPGCDDAECCEAVCAADSFCCETEWDGICADAALEICGNCGGGGAGDCCADNGTPGCNDAACCELICVQDAFCCENNWDGICADAATEQCDVCQVGPGDCCVEGGNGTPGCDDPDCEALICAQDSFCCATSWDGICADAAQAQCGICGGCCQANGTPGCNDQDCQDLICAQDSFCCDTSWDGICADAAVEQCTVCGGMPPVPTGACCFPDGSCAELTAAECGPAGGAYQGDDTVCGPGVCPQPSACPGDGSCFEDNGTPGCDDAECCEAVCAIDSFCCETEWDGICADEAFEICGDCGSAGAGDCCSANGTPGCNDFDCCALICAQDAFCCDNSWDGICADAAIEQCEVCIPDPTGACCINDKCFELTAANCAESGGEYFGDGIVCAPGLCEKPNPCPGDGDCCINNGTPGCEDAECCELICSQDSFCCNTSWDGICADAAVDQCEVCAVGGCVGDLDGDGDTDSGDLNILLGDFGCTSGCVGDLDGDDDTDSGDLNVLLGDFGCTP